MARCALKSYFTRAAPQVGGRADGYRIRAARKPPMKPKKWLLHDIISWGISDVAIAVP